MRPTASRATSAICLVLTASILVGCGLGKAPTPESTATDCPVTANPEVTTEVKIAYQIIPNADMIVKDQGLLEVCLPNATITWNQFDSGGDVVQAFASGSADIGLMGSSPATQALSAPLNIPMKVIWVHDVIGTAEALVAKDPAARSIKDLRGKKIGVPFSSTSHFSLLRALDAAGMTVNKDVTLINLSPDKVLAAWQRGDVDAAWIWDPVLSELQTDGNVVATSEETAEAGSPTYDLAGASTAFIEANPGVMSVWTAVEDYAVRQITSEPDKAAESIAVQLSVSPEVVTKQLKGYTYLTADQQAGDDYLGGGLASDFEDTAKFLLSQGEIDAVSTPTAYEAGIYPTAAKEAGK